jgi:hypothetical protein
MSGPCPDHEQVLPVKRLLIVGGGPRKHHVPASPDVAPVVALTSRSRFSRPPPAHDRTALSLIGRRRRLSTGFAAQNRYGVAIEHDTLRGLASFGIGGHNPASAASSRKIQLRNVRRLFVATGRYQSRQLDLPDPATRLAWWSSAGVDSTRHRGDAPLSWRSNRELRRSRRGSSAVRG